MNNMHRKQKRDIGKGARDRVCHRPVSEHGSAPHTGQCHSNPVTPGCCSQPQSLDNIWHLKHICSGCLSWGTVCGPPGTCSWDRTKLLKNTRAALSGATVQEHPRAWHKVAPTPNWDWCSAPGKSLTLPTAQRALTTDSAPFLVVAKPKLGAKRASGSCLR